MDTDKQNILKHLCYTELVYQRINKKLGTERSKKEIEEYLFQVLEETDIKNYKKTGKNFYVSNTEHQIRITINSYTFRVITVDKLK